jgi:toxin ParE1/3/4
MKVLPYVISKKAIADLEEIWLYTADKWSIVQADRYYNLIFDEIAFICKSPETGKQMDDIRKNYRAAKVKSHLIFFKVENEIVQIVRILHERMDIKSRLDSD